MSCPPFGLLEALQKQVLSRLQPGHSGEKLTKECPLGRCVGASKCSAVGDNCAVGGLGCFCERRVPATLNNVAGSNLFPRETPKGLLVTRVTPRGVCGGDMFVCSGWVSPCRQVDVEYSAVSGGS